MQTFHFAWLFEIENNLKYFSADNTLRIWLSCGVLDETTQSNDQSTAMFMKKIVWIPFSRYDEC